MIQTKTIAGCTPTLEKQNYTRVLNTRKLFFVKREKTDESEWRNEL